jgi:mono/diheme cytochrome c family protein
MKNIAAFLAFVFTIVFLFGFTYSLNGNSDPDGKQIFTEKKCSSCHSVASMDITSKKKDASDLSNAGTLGDAEFMAGYLTKKEKIDGKEHKAPWKGTDQELKTISEWLAGLNAEKSSKTDETKKTDKTKKTEKTDKK